MHPAEPTRLPGPVEATLAAAPRARGRSRPAYSCRRRSRRWSVRALSDAGAPTPRRKRARIAFRRSLSRQRTVAGHRLLARRASRPMTKSVRLLPEHRPEAQTALVGKVGVEMRALSTVGDPLQCRLRACRRWWSGSRDAGPPDAVAMVEVGPDVEPDIHPTPDAGSTPGRPMPRPAADLVPVAALLRPAAVYRDRGATSTARQRRPGDSATPR